MAFLIGLSKYNVSFINLFSKIESIGNAFPNSLKNSFISSLVCRCLKPLLAKFALGKDDVEV